MLVFDALSILSSRGFQNVDKGCTIFPKRYAEGYAKCFLSVVKKKEKRKKKKQGRSRRLKQYGGAVRVFSAFLFIFANDEAVDADGHIIIYYAHFSERK